MCFPFESNLGIIIGTIGTAAKNHQVLTVKGQTYVTMRRHIPRIVLSCPMEWIPYAMKIPYRVSRLIGTA